MMLTESKKKEGGSIQISKSRYSHAGRLDMSAETAHGIPKFERAPLMIPQGK